MSMKEKALLIKEDFDQLYDAGKQSVIDNSKYIEKTASGKVIRLDDVSEVAHKVVVKADTPTEVKVYGKNLFKTTNSTQGGLNGTTGNMSNSSNYILTTDYIRLASGDYVLSNKVGANLRYIAFYNINKEFVSSTWTDRAKTYKFTANEDCYIRIDVEKDGNVAIDNREVFVKEYEFMLELGSIVSPYEEYQCQTITATPEGTEISSMCPDMTFLADNDVTVDYFSSYGMQTEYDEFWDNFQNYGKRTGYGTAFSEAWNETIFKPKYDIKADVATNIFYYSRIENLEKILSDCGVVLDLSVCVNLSYAFGYSTITHVPVLNLSKCTNTSYLFANFSESSTNAWRSQLKSVRKIISSETTVFANNAFSNCRHLEHCIFEGTIASNINLQWSPKLDIESLVSLINCLKSFNGDATDEWKKTITLSADSWALLRAQGEIFEAFGWEVKVNVDYYLDEVVRWKKA